jgi:phage terminase large subunit-like protein
MADRKVRIINALTHTKGPHAGQGFNLRPWQEHEIVRPLFTTDARGRRQYRTCLLMMPRKNGKTELAAALAIDGLLFDGEQGAEVYSAAADRDQASLVFHVAAQMLRNDAELAAQVQIVDSQRRIVHRASGSVYRAISAEAYSKHGFNASRVIYDELHAAPERELWDVMSSSTGARDQPLMIAISTAGFDRHSILWELYSYAKKIQADPSLDPSFLSIIYEAPPGADWREESTWAACNPALGDFRSWEEMRTACARAQLIPEQENTFRRLYLNQWTEQSSRWLSLEAWDACLGSRGELAPRRRCYLGADLSSTKDFTALVGVFPDDTGGGFDVRAHFVIPADTAGERERRDHLPIAQWVREGWLTLSPGPVVDYEAIRVVVKAWMARYDVRELGVDPWNATDLVTRLSDQDGLTCIMLRQGYATLSAPTKNLEATILGRALRHDGNPVLRRMVSVVAIETDAAGNIKPSKVKSSDRIDGVVALVLALDRASRQTTPTTPKYQMLVY